MSLVPAALLSLFVLSAVGVLPTVALCGSRVLAVALAPLAGAVTASLAATFFVAWGWTFGGWLTTLAVVFSAAAVGVWIRWPMTRPFRDRGQAPVRGRANRLARIAAAAGMVGVVGASAWCLRNLSTPTVGFDARAVWLLRGGWFLEPHARALLDFTSIDIPFTQTSYPPLVSASSSVAQLVTGTDSPRLDVVVVALLNTSALLAASWALVVAGRSVAGRLTRPVRRDRLDDRPRAMAGTAWTVLPAAVGAVAGVLVVFVAFGITEPFMTNGYADPIWSLAAVGAVAYGLQLPSDRSTQGAALVLVLVAGLSKDEGLLAAIGIAALIAGRRLAALTRARRQGRRRWGPVAILGGEVVVLAMWPAAMGVVHARTQTLRPSPLHEWPARARETYDGMAPHLHVIVVAVLVAAIGGLVLRRVRRRAGLANDAWAWASLVLGLLAIGSGFLTGNAPLRVVDVVHRVTEFPALAAWWIVGMWAVVGSAAPAAAAPGGHDDSTVSRREAESAPWVDRRVAVAGAGAGGRDR